jgi:tetratricopeptide (TPR) repeat protein
MPKPQSREASDAATSGPVVRALKDDLRRIVPLWAVLIVCSGLAVALLRFYSVPLITKIEYGTANPYSLALIYAEEGKKYYEKCLKKIEQQKREGRSQPLLRDDPDLARAKRVLLHSLSLYANNPDLYNYLAGLAAFEGNEADVHYYQALVSAAKGLPDGEAGPTARALEELDAALKIDPKKTDAILKKAEILIAANRLDEAEAEITEITEKQITEMKEKQNAVQGQAWYLLARIEAGRAHWGKVREDLQRSLALDPRNRDAAKMLADYLFAGGDKEGALKVLADAERLAPNDANLKHRLGRMLTSLQRYDDAARILERAVEQEHTSALLYLDLARTYRRLGKERLAAIALERAMRLDPTLRDKVLGE